MMQLLYQLLLVLLITIVFVIISHSYHMKLVRYYNGFEAVSYSKAKDLSILFPVFSHTPLTPVFTTCLRVTGLRHMNPLIQHGPALVGRTPQQGCTRVQHIVEKSRMHVRSHICDRSCCHRKVWNQYVPRQPSRSGGVCLMAPPLLNTFPKRRSVPINRVRHTKENSWHLRL